MATAPSSQLEDRMCCSVCMEWFNNGRHVPKILPCHHTFCESCIVQSTNQKSRPPSLNCPICRCHHIIPQGGFITNRAVMDIVDEHQKDATGKTSSSLKCTKHANKEAVLVCIDCLDALCLICVKSSRHIKDEHHVEEVDEAAPVLQQMFRPSQSSFKKKLMEKSHCSSTELAIAESDIKLLANKIHAETTKWENEQLSMVREMKSFVDVQENEKIDIDLNTLFPKIKQNQLRSDVQDKFMNKLHQRQAEDQNRFYQRLQNLLKKLQSEIESINAVQSKYLKNVGLTSAISTEQGSLQSVTRETKYKHQVSTSKQVPENKFPKSSNVLYKVKVIDPDELWYCCVKLHHGDVIAVTEEHGRGLLQGIHEGTDKQCYFHEKGVVKIK